MSIALQIANELNLTSDQVVAVIKLLDEGSTVPFISRYRKEVTGGVDDACLRQFEERLSYLRELEDRRSAVLKSIEEQGKLTDELKKQILNAESKTRLEDLYLPYKQKRRTKAQIAKEAGLAPFLEVLLENQQSSDIDAFAQEFFNTEHAIDTTEAALEGARHIFMEQVVEAADLVGRLREYVWDHGTLEAKVVEGQEEAGEKFTDYFDFSEALSKLPSHRILALFRARREGILRIKVSVAGQDDVEDKKAFGRCDQMIAGHFAIKSTDSKVSVWLAESVRWAWRVKAAMQLESEVFLNQRGKAEEEAISVFGHNLKDLLLAAPAGAKVTMGLDPGYRTGVKVAVVDATGKLLAHDTIYPHVPKKQWDASLASLAKLVKAHTVELISVGNGTASRETDKLARELIKAMSGVRLSSIVVSEAGASVYSASAFASKEFPDLDVTIRGAVSIARRLQDPLAELVKIDPKAIGVGQYQHDVNQTKLAKKLEATVEDCVNAVGVDVNTASAPLLARVAGLSESLASNIVMYREELGSFSDRKQLLSVPRLGPKAYEQAAGFLRITGGSNPLDSSAVHPEAYPLVERIIVSTKSSIQSLMGDARLLASLSANDFVDDRFGAPTVKDVIGELEKPGRDPRPEFKSAAFKEGVETVKDLMPGMLLEGVVSNVANFGAFVDLGVHQDGLVHVSAMSTSFIKDPRDVVKTGDVVKVKVLEVDVKRKRISLTMRLTDELPNKQESDNKSNQRPERKNTQSKPKVADSAGMSVMAEAFAKLKR